MGVHESGVWKGKDTFIPFKERLEIFGGGKIILLDNFKKLKAWGVPGFKNKNLFKRGLNNYYKKSKFKEILKQNICI